MALRKSQKFEKDLKKKGSRLENALTENKIFGVGFRNVNLQKRCRILNTLAKEMAANKLPEASQR